MDEQPPAETTAAESAAAPAETSAVEDEQPAVSTTAAGEAAASASPTSFVFLA